MKIALLFLTLCLAVVALITVTLKADVDEKLHPTNNDATFASKDDLITLMFPMVGQVIQSPLNMAGKARGMWYFEASFPIELFDGNGELIGSAVAQATSNWMTTDYVPFTANLFFETPETDTGILVLRKDNPSGDPANDNALSIHVRFRE